MTTKDELVERRRSGVRATTEINVDLSVLGNYHLSKISNISTGGAFIHHPQVSPVGTIIKISFKLPSESKPIETEAEVAWSYTQAGRSKHSSTGMGVKFLQINPEDQKKIQNYIDQQLKSPTKKKR